MVAITFLCFVVYITHRCQMSEAALNSEEILNLKDVPDDDDDPAIEIDELMPNGGSDESLDGLEQETKVENRADYDKTELMRPRTNGSDEHFVKMAPKEHRMASTITKVNRWPIATVPYVFSNVLRNNRVLHSKVYPAMKEWMTKSCISFEPYSRELAQLLGHNQKVLIRDDLSGCYSRMGKIPINARVLQEINLERPGCWHPRLVLHELGHTIGLWHEQSRQDRDNFLQINWKNIIPGDLYRYQFLKQKDNYRNDNTPYDYLSIMHYGKLFFSSGRPSLLTMVPRNRCYLDIIGNRRHLSYYDHKAVNTLYGCTIGCDASACGKDCYATKTTNNERCQCFCKDEDNDPCQKRGGRRDPDASGNSGNSVDRRNSWNRKNRWNKIYPTGRRNQGRWGRRDADASRESDSRNPVDIRKSWNRKNQWNKRNPTEWRNQGQMTN